MTSVKKNSPPRVSNLKSQISNLKSPTLYDHIPKLVAKAEHHYARNRHFRKLLRASDNNGRDSLQSFMRHWLAALLHQNHPALFAELPRSFQFGQPLTSSDPQS